MTLLLILSLIMFILITYLLGTGIANVVIRRREKREAKERKRRALDNLLMFEL